MNLCQLPVIQRQNIFKITQKREFLPLFIGAGVVVGVAGYALGEHLFVGYKNREVIRQEEKKKERLLNSPNVGVNLGTEHMRIGNLLFPSKESQAKWSQLLKIKSPEAFEDQNLVSSIYRISQDNLRRNKEPGNVILSFSSQLQTIESKQMRLESFKQNLLSHSMKQHDTSSKANQSNSDGNNDEKYSNKIQSFNNATIFSHIDENKAALLGALELGLLDEQGITPKNNSSISSSSSCGKYLLFVDIGGFLTQVSLFSGFQSDDFKKFGTGWKEPNILSFAISQYGTSNCSQGVENTNKLERMDENLRSLISQVLKVLSSSSPVVDAKLKVLVYGGGALQKGLCQAVEAQVKNSIADLGPGYHVGMTMVDVLRPDELVIKGTSLAAIYEWCTFSE